MEKTGDRELEGESDSESGDVFGVVWVETAEGSWLHAAASKRRASKSVVMKDG